MAVLVRTVLWQRLFALASAGACLGCSSLHGWPPREYVCSDRTAFIAQYDPDNDRMVLHRLDGADGALDRQFSRFGGARYSDGKVELFAKKGGAVRMKDAATGATQFCQQATY
jgi:hypothetical protein